MQTRWLEAVLLTAGVIGAALYAQEPPKAKADKPEPTVAELQAKVAEQEKALATAQKLINAYQQELVGCTLRGVNERALREEKK